MHRLWKATKQQARQVLWTGRGTAWERCFTEHQWINRHRS